MQVLDVTVNKIMKLYIEEAEDQWVDEHFEEWKAGKFNVGDRRVLLTKWVGEAWKKLHEFHKDAIIETFQNVGLSLPTDGSKDNLLKIRDLPDIIVGDWQQVLKGTTKNPTIIPNNASESIEVDDEEKEDDITTDSRDESEEQFDYDSQSDFDDDVDGDEVEEDEYM